MLLLFKLSALPVLLEDLSKSFIMHIAFFDIEIDEEKIHLTYIFDSDLVGRMQLMIIKG